MRYTLDKIKLIDMGKFEIIFSNGVNKETIIAGLLSIDNWCLYNQSGKPINFYSNVEDLISDFENDLNLLLGNKGAYN